MQLRIRESDWHPFCDALMDRRDVESAGLLLGAVTPTPNGTVITIKETVIFDDEAFLVRRIDQISLNPVVLNQHFRRARKNGWCVMTIHTHPHASTPWFSNADDAGDARLMPSLANQVPDVPHGSIVLTDKRNAIARVFSEHTAPQSVSIQIVGDRITKSNINSFAKERWFGRQSLALGADGQHQLRGLRVGVVGLGGTGSLVAMQLSHLGVGEMVLIDGDVIEASNLSRVVGATKRDIDRTMKVDIATRYAESTGLNQNVDPHCTYLTAESEALIASCDIVFSCVDNQTPRALLNRWAYRHLVPLIDMGTAFRVDAAGAVTGEAGRVVVVGPGRPCLACWGHLNGDALRNEALSPEDRQHLIDDGYIQGAHVDQPSVIAFNAIVAASSVVEALRIISGFSGSAPPPQRLAFSFSAGTAKRNSLDNDIQCNICGC